MTELEQEIAHLQELRAKHRKNIHRLEEQLATYGKADAPLHLFNKLDSEQEQLRRVEERMEELLVQARTEEIPAKSVRLPYHAPPESVLAKPRRPVNWERVGAIAGVAAVLIALGAWLVPNVADFLSARLFETPTMAATLPTPTSVPSTDTPTPTRVPPTDAPTPSPSPPPVMERVQPFEPEMILIPAGEFLMGSDPRKDKDARDNEQPQHTLYLPDYYMARTAVTNAQYAAFVYATGHEQPILWEGGKPPTGKEDHPVVFVSWHDAVAYCDWLAEVTGKPYRLPSEAEWEKGARGTDGYIYPWGNQWDEERCNSGEDDEWHTTPVGAYPEGASPYGLQDMAGNVWEWTRSLWGEDDYRASFKYPYDPEDGREDLEAGGFHVLRGGSFYFDRTAVRCAFRGGPDDSFSDGEDFGFRVVVSPGSSLDSGTPGP
jgi:formylglycine-generating enzyme required for sulfatase activity